MTAIMALKDGDKYILGCDGISSTEKYMIETPFPDSYKIRHLNSPNVVIGVAGKVITNDVVKNISNLLNGKTDIDFNFVVKQVLPILITNLKDANLLFGDDESYSTKSTIIIATKKHLFYINSWGVVSECDSVVFTGSGGLALYTKYNQLKDTDMDKEQIVEECLKHSIKHGKVIGYPIIIMDTKGKERVIEKE